MAELKTKLTDASVADFIDNVVEPELRPDCWELVRMMQEVSGSPAKMWGTSIVGFGLYRYVYSSGRSGDWMILGFSPRKQNLSIYLMCTLEDRADLLSKLGKYKVGKSCLYVKSLSDIDKKVLRHLANASYDFVAKRYQVLKEAEVQGQGLGSGKAAGGGVRSREASQGRTSELKLKNKKAHSMKSSLQTGKVVKDSGSESKAAKRPAKKTVKSTKQAIVESQQETKQKAKAVAKKPNAKKTNAKKPVAKKVVAKSRVSRKGKIKKR